MVNHAIAASLMAADLTHLGDEIAAMTHAGIDAFHWDITDGHFVPNLNFGPDHIKQTRSLTPVYFDVHLMVSKPEHWIDIMAGAGADAISFHAELSSDRTTLIKNIHDRDCDAGIAFNPETPLSVIDLKLWQNIDRIIIMTVKPGFGGQGFMDQSEKIRQAATLKEKYPHLQIVVDGGINATTAIKARQAGATTLVSGSFLFGQKNNYEAAIGQLRGDAS